MPIFPSGCGYGGPRYAWRGPPSSGEDSAEGTRLLAYLESTATLAEVKAQYETCSTYDLVADLTLCREFIQACRILISRTSDETRQGSAALRDNAAKYRTELERAMAWLSARDADFAGAQTAGSVRVVSLAGIRDL